MLPVGASARNIPSVKPSGETGDIVDPCQPSGAPGGQRARRAGGRDRHSSAVAEDAGEDRSDMAGVIAEIELFADLRL